MHRQRTTSAVLVLLLVWQLLASALAHPLELPLHGQRNVTASEPFDCPDAVVEQVVGQTAEHAAVEWHSEMSMQTLHATITQDVVLQQASSHDWIKHPCKSVCKCPCAGTPALASVLPQLSAALPEEFFLLPQSINAPPAIVSKLLRPPIA